ncbi:hypothetical protein F4805DRAFT_277067 [Annulohypoxylon moriforme]|nr:hypothetical protein F4805DRAFT_277067 [Annulohypoxylon moriforme]
MTHMTGPLDESAVRLQHLERVCAVVSHSHVCEMWSRMCALAEFPNAGVVVPGQPYDSSFHPVYERGISVVEHLQRDEQGSRLD